MNLIVFDWILQKPTKMGTWKVALSSIWEKVGREEIHLDIYISLVFSYLNTFGDMFT